MQPFTASALYDTLCAEYSSVHAEIKLIEHFSDLFGCKLLRCFYTPACKYFISVMVMVVTAAAIVIVVMMMVMTAAAFIVVVVMVMVMTAAAIIVVIVMMVVTAAAFIVVVMMVMMLMFVMVVMMLMVMFIMIVVMMMVVFMNRFMSKLIKELVSERLVSLHSLKDLCSRKIIPWSSYDLCLSIMLAEQLYSSFELFF